MYTKNYIKRSLLNVGAALLLMLLAACGGASPAPGSTTPTQIGSPNPPSPTVLASPTATSMTPSPSRTAAVPTTPSVTASPSPSQAQTGSPSIQILAPVDFPSFHTAVVEQGLKIAVQVSGFKLVDKVGQPATPGEGHIIYYVDVDPPNTSGTSAVTTGGSYVTSADTAIVWANLPKGAHKVAVQLVNNDNTPLTPPVVDKVQTYLSLVVGAPNIRISSPGVAATLPAGNITIQVAIRDFISVYNPTKDNIRGEGHIIYCIDTDPPFEPKKPALTANGTYANTAAFSYTWQDVTPGFHTFSVQLVNNDSSPLTDPPSTYPAADKIKVLVK